MAERVVIEIVFGEQMAIFRQSDFQTVAQQRSPLHWSCDESEVECLRYSAIGFQMAAEFFVADKFVFHKIHNWRIAIVSNGR